MNERAVRMNGGKAFVADDMLFEFLYPNLAPVISLKQKKGLDL